MIILVLKNYYFLLLNEGFFFLVFFVRFVSILVVLVWNNDFFVWVKIVVSRDIDYIKDLVVLFKNEYEDYGLLYYNNLLRIFSDLVL